MAISKRRVGWANMLWVLFMAGSVSAVRAQGAAPSEAGFQPNRDYLALQPFEAIDTASNNVILTFTDLVLPGNGGRELRFERVFSNQVVQDPAGPQWRFGIAGVPMRVVERPRPTPQRPIRPSGDIAAERLTTPYFWMLDGSRLETTYVEAPDPGQASTLANVQTPGFWRYDRDAARLRLPDGRVAVYELQVPTFTLWLKTMTDPFGNTVTLTRTAGGLEVVQSLGNGQARHVLVDIDGATGLPMALTYDGLTWAYRYDAQNPGQLRQVDPPLGPPWAYQYSTEPYSAGKVTRVTTPQGGEIEYVYGDREFFVPGSPSGFPDVFNVLVTRRMHDRGRLLGEWTFEHSAVTELAFDRTVITLPSGTTVEYDYGPWSLQALAGTWLLRSRFVRAPDGREMEAEALEYELLPAARREEAWGVPRLRQRTITRGGRAYTTEYEYTIGGGSTPGCPILNTFHNYHRPTAVTERGRGGTVERTTRLTYTHLGCPYVLALPASESITITGMTAARNWTYNETTGFRETETRYGITTRFAPDPFGNIAAATRANGNVTSFTYSWGVLSQASTPGVVVAREIDAHGTVASDTVAGRTTTYEYDDLFRLERTRPPGGTRPIMTAYDNAAGRTTTTSRGDAFVTTIVDGFGRPIATENSAGARTHTAYDAEGRKTYQSVPFEGDLDGPADIGTQFVYDGLGRVTRETNPDQTTRTRTYDDAANTVTVRDEENQPTAYAYHAFGHPDAARLVAVVDARGQEWTYTYDAIGNLAQVVGPDGVARTWIRNASGLLTSETHPESGTVTYTEYDAAGVLKQRVDANGTAFVYTHDGNDRVTRVTAGARVTDTSYESGSDRRLSMSNGDVSTTFAYDPAGRVAQRQDVVGSSVFTSQYAYDDSDRITAITYPSGRMVGYDRATDTEGRITRVFEDAVGRDYAFGLTYHASGALGGYTAGNLTPTAIGYDPRRYWVTSIRSGALGLTYGNYDAVGNVGTIADSRGGLDQTFTYDALHRLETVDAPYGGAGYGYDAHGNRSSTAGLTYLYEAGTLRLASFNGIPYTYDNNGNLKVAGGDTFNYTVENMLASASVGGSAAAYAYDADQWRVKRTTPTETTYYLRGLSGELLTEWRVPAAGDSAIRDYVYAGPHLLSAVERMTPPPTSNDTYGTIVPNGPAVTATLTAAGRRVLLQFAGLAGHRYRAAAWLASGQFGCGAWLELRTAAGDLVANASSGPTCASRLLDAVVLPASGTYYVVIDPLDANTGTASVRLYDIYAVIAPNGPTVTVPVNTNGQRLLVEFAGTQGQQYSAVTDTVAGAGGCGYRPEIRTPQWALVPTARTSSGCTFVMDVLEVGALPSTWIHFVVLDPIATSQHNSARVWLYGFVDVAAAIPTNGTVVVAALTKPGQRALLPFGGAAGQRIAARVEVTSGNLGCSWWLEILKPDNSYFPNYVGTCSGAYAFHEPVTLATAGTYRVFVDPKSTSTGTASVTAYVVPPDVTGAVTINGAAVPVALTGVGQQARLSFPGAGGQSVTVRLTSNTIGQTTVRLLRPNGTWQTYATSNGGSFNLPASALASTGTYTILVDPYDLNTGGLSVQVTSP